MRARARARFVPSPVSIPSDSPLGVFRANLLFAEYCKLRASLARENREIATARRPRSRYRSLAHRQVYVATSGGRGQGAREIQIPGGGRLNGARGTR